MQKNYSKEHILFLKNQKKKTILIKIYRFGLFVVLLIFWELAVKLGWIDGFLLSSPSRIMKAIIGLYSGGRLFENIGYTAAETTAGFILGTTLGIVISVLIWWSDFVSEILEPYLVILNALPKIAFGPIIIVWLGAGIYSIILVSLLMSVIISTINILSAFNQTDKEKILLMKSLGASKFKIFQKLVFPSNINNIISTLKINVGMSLIGVITGEFLVSNKGVGYLIVYGSQVFKLDLVMSGIFILAILAYLMYLTVSKIEKKFKNSGIADN
jgi:NitT/TauT family transport system permease protein